MVYNLFENIIAKFRDWDFILCLRFSFLALVDKTIHLTVFVVASILVGFVSLPMQNEMPNIFCY